MGCRIAGRLRSSRLVDSLLKNDVSSQLSASGRATHDVVDAKHSGELDLGPFGRLERLGDAQVEDDGLVGRESASGVREKRDRTDHGFF